MTIRPFALILFSSLAPDTRDEAERVQIELLRQAPAWRKLHLLAQMNSAVQTLAMSGLRSRHPRAAPTELRRRLADLCLGAELAARVYGPLAATEEAERAG